MVQTVAAQLPKLHTLIIGPGLGRDSEVLAGVAQVQHPPCHITIQWMIRN
jgi:NAD(P)H-hydrate repair Nnr-like enzyme with NAD(P)H-hydrate dehydratase domain